MKIGLAAVAALLLITQPASAATGDQIGTLIEVEGAATISRIVGDTRNRDDRCADRAR